MITTLWFLLYSQSDPITRTPGEDGSVTIPVKDDGVTVTVVLEETNPDEPVKVGSIEVTACGEPPGELLLLLIVIVVVVVVVVVASVVSNGSGFCC